MVYFEYLIHSLTVYFYSHNLLASSTGDFQKRHMSQCCMRSPVEVDVESEMENIRELYCVLLSCFHTVNYAHLQCVVNLFIQIQYFLELLNLTVWCSAKIKSGWTAIFSKLYGKFKLFIPLSVANFIGICMKLSMNEKYSWLTCIGLEPFCRRATEEPFFVSGTTAWSLMTEFLIDFPNLNQGWLMFFAQLELKHCASLALKLAS
jgi:hypothetical protein